MVELEGFRIDLPGEEMDGPESRSPDAWGDSSPLQLLSIH